MPEDFTTPEDVQPQVGQGDPSGDPSAVQPEGQGQQDAQTGLYDLSTVDEALRPAVEQHLKQIEENANKRFREHADFKKAWQPYEELGLNQVDPEQLTHVLEFISQLQEEDTAKDAVRALATELGLQFAEEPADAGEPDPVAQLDTRLARLEAWEASQQEAKDLAAAQEAIRAEWAEVQAAHGAEFSKEEAEDLASLAGRFAEEDAPVKAAYAFLQRIKGATETALVKQKALEPKPAARGGRASTAATPPDSFEEANRLHRERSAQSQVTA